MTSSKTRHPYIKTNLASKHETSVNRNQGISFFFPRFKLRRFTAVLLGPSDEEEEKRSDPCSTAAHACADESPKRPLYIDRARAR